jgi:hypothetical protein
MDLRSRLRIQLAGYYFLILLPSFLVVGLFFFSRMLNQYVVIATVLGAVIGAFMVIKTVDTMRGLRDDEKTRNWLEAAVRKDAAIAEAEERDAAK